MACTEAIYNKSSMPSLLKKYGFEEKRVESERQKNYNREKELKADARKARKTNSFDHQEVDVAAEKEKEKDEYYQQMVKDLYKLRDYYYSEYSSLLLEKVQKQRREQKERDALLMREREKKEEEEKKATHSVKKRLQRHTLETTPVTVPVPKTDLYHIVGLERKLKQEGKLKTMSDYNKFRQDMQDPVKFNAFFRPSAQSDARKSPVSSILTSSQRGSSEVFSLPPDAEVDERLGNNLRSLSRISESYNEASRPGTRTENWAVTHQYPSLHRRRSSGLELTKKVKADQVSDLDKRFPKLEMPKLHCFNMNLAPKPPDPEEVRQQLELRNREKQRKKMLRTVTKMYQLAMSNAATSNRIIDGQENVGLMLNGPDLCDVIADHHWMKAYGLQEMPEELSGDLSQEQEIMEDIFLTENHLDNDVTPAEGLESIQQEERSSKASSKRSSAQSRKSLPSIGETKTPQPLTMTAIEDNSRILEAKTLSTLWTNYVGKTP